MPNRVNLINPNATQGAQVQTMNQALRVLDREAVVKKFNGNSGESLIIGKTGDDTLGVQAKQGDNIAMQIGKYNATRYGMLFYDANGIPIILIGQAPDDGRMGMWQVKPGQNVLTQLGG
jgi:hypothetical protein